MGDVAAPMPGIDVDLAAVGEACRRFGVLQLDVFGSVVTGAFVPGHSDVDLLVRFESDSYVGAADRYFGLKEDMAALFGRPVDLLTERSIRNPYLRRQIEVERRRIFPLP